MAVKSELKRKIAKTLLAAQGSTWTLEACRMDRCVYCKYWRIAKFSGNTGEIKEALCCNKKNRVNNPASDYCCELFEADGEFDANDEYATQLDEDIEEEKLERLRGI